MKKILLIALVALGLSPLTPAHAATAPDVLYIHGYINSTGCAGIRTAVQAAPLATTLKAAGYTGTVKGVDYLCGDSTGVDIKPYGTLPKSGYTANAPIENIAQALCGYIAANYTEPVNIVAHSMGGLIGDYAVKACGARVGQLVTLSTPRGGWDETPVYLMGLTCGGTEQCRQMTVGSPFLTNLATLPVPASTDSTAIGGSPKDVFTFASISAGQAQHKVDYYATTPVNYGHSAYLTDTSALLNVPARINGVAVTNQPHSLRMVARALMSADY